MSRVAALQGLAVRGGPALVGPAAASYRALAESVAAYLRRGTGAHVYARGSLARAEAVPGLSDLDLVAVVPDPAPRPELAQALLSIRRRLLSERFPLLARLVTVATYTERELRSAASSTTLTWALGTAAADIPRGRAVHFRSAAPADELGLRSRPGIPGGTAGWLPLGSAPHAPATPAWSGVERLHVAWLELQYWWRHACRLALEPESPVAHYTCVKLVAESARTWLWLSEDGVPPSRRAALERRVDPEAEAALAIERRLPARAAPPVTEALTALVRGSRRVAGRLAEAADDAGYESVDLLGELPGDLLPLADWRARAFSELPDETCIVADGEPSDPRALAAATGSVRLGHHPLLVSDGLLVAPGTEPLPLRGLECPVTDPVTFALLEGRREARFPRLAGWSARDGARRAVAEHRSWLAGWSREPAPTERALGLLLTAARAAFFLDSVEAGRPGLPLTVVATVEALGWPESALEDVASARQLVETLPAYAGI